MGRRNILIAGNWKMNGNRADGARFLEQLAALAPATVPGRRLLICPPATLISAMAEGLGTLGIAIGAQDCHFESKGAFTGDVSAPMLADQGCTHVIVGHSERRAMHHETDAQVRAKAAAALKVGLTPIICVGETWAEREAGQAEAIVRTQVAGSIPDGIGPESLVIAYEPIWAIGTGKTATLEDIDAIHRVIRAGFADKSGGGGLILYGGSVKPGNAAEILGLGEVDGALIGGASLDAGDFMAIVNAAPNAG